MKRTAVTRFSRFLCFGEANLLPNFRGTRNRVSLHFYIDFTCKPNALAASIAFGVYTPLGVEKTTRQCICCHILGSFFVMDLQIKILY